jgi:hypothetical protein
VQHHIVPEVLAGMQKVIEKQNGALVAHVFAQGGIEFREWNAVAPSTEAGAVRLCPTVIQPILVLSRMTEIWANWMVSSPCCGQQKESKRRLPNVLRYLCKGRLHNKNT